MTTGRVVRDARRLLDDAGLVGSFLVRDLDSGAEVGLDPDVAVPAASLVKLPLALAVLERIADGRLDGATPVELTPGQETAQGPAGVTKFRHPVAPALDDVVYLSTCLSDNAAADALFALVPPGEVTGWLRERDVEGMTVRHSIADLADTPVEAMPDDPGLALTLAARGSTGARGHRVRQLDVARASVTTARALADLLALVWRPDGRIDQEVARRTRDLLADNVHRHRLWPDFSSDTSRWSSKTGTVLTLRHEAGVVEHADGSRFAVVALTTSRVAAVVQPAAEATSGRVARLLHDHLRGSARDDTRGR